MHCKASMHLSRNSSLWCFGKVTPLISFALVLSLQLGAISQGTEVSVNRSRVSHMVPRRIPDGALCQAMCAPHDGISWKEESLRKQADENSNAQFDTSLLPFLLSPAHRILLCPFFHSGQRSHCNLAVKGLAPVIPKEFGAWWCYETADPLLFSGSKARLCQYWIQRICNWRPSRLFSFLMLKQSE